ncbi:MAG: hypothetical protein G01um101433_675 [Parcubacteria group bacterium Gr01-1014_33]|nr:MAG: hypothetical protein G01um101433_675 [Parcubacteria group bacterium Gr01-1014_33]
MKKGFTLVELLVTISIISVLASVVLTSVNSARAKARDARRLSDLKQYQLALEFYYDKYNSYPPTHSDTGWGQDRSDYDGDTLAPEFLTILRTEGMLPQTPVDPINVYDVANNYSVYLYRQCSGGQGYVLQAMLITQPSQTGPWPPCWSTRHCLQVGTVGTCGM